MLEQGRICLLLKRQNTELGGHEDVGAGNLGHLFLAGDDNKELRDVKLDDTDDALDGHGLVATGCGAMFGETDGAVVAVDHEYFCRSRRRR